MLARAVCFACVTSFSFLIGGLIVLDHFGPVLGSMSDNLLHCHLVGFVVIMRSVSLWMWMVLIFFCLFV